MRLYFCNILFNCYIFYTKMTTNTCFLFWFCWFFFAFIYNTALLMFSQFYFFSWPMNNVPIFIIFIYVNKMNKYLFLMVFSLLRWMRHIQKDLKLFIYYYFNYYCCCVLLLFFFFLVNIKMSVVYLLTKHFSTVFFIY